MHTIYFPYRVFGRKHYNVTNYANHYVIWKINIKININKKQKKSNSKLYQISRQQRGWVQSTKKLVFNSFITSVT